MANSEFEWDNRKAAANFAKHGVSFDKAREVFNDPFAVDRLDDRADYSEQRFVISAWWTVGYYSSHIP